MKKTFSIVAVEDTPFWLNNVSDIFKQYFDTEIESFISFGLAAKRLIKQPQNIDLLITDVFPEYSGEPDGLQLAKLVNENNNNTPVIFLTGYPDSVHSNLKTNNIVDVFDKGEFDKMAFITTIQERLENKKISPNNEIGVRQDSIKDFYSLSVETEVITHKKTANILRKVSNQNFLIPVKNYGSIPIRNLIIEVENFTDKGRAFIKVWAQSTKSLRK